MPRTGGQILGVVEAVEEGLAWRSRLFGCADSGGVDRGGSSIEMMLISQPILTQLISEAGHALNLLLVRKDNVWWRDEKNQH